MASYSGSAYPGQDEEDPNAPPADAINPASGAGGGGGAAVGSQNSSSPSPYAPAPYPTLAPSNAATSGAAQTASQTDPTAGYATPTPYDAVNPQSTAASGASSPPSSSAPTAYTPTAASDASTGSNVAGAQMVGANAPTAPQGTSSTPTAYTPPATTPATTPIPDFTGSGTGMQGDAGPAQPLPTDAVDQGVGTGLTQTPTINPNATPPTGPATDAGGGSSIANPPVIGEGPPPPPPPPMNPAGPPVAPGTQGTAQVQGNNLLTDYQSQLQNLDQGNLAGAQGVNTNQILQSLLTGGNAVQGPSAQTTSAINNLLANPSAYDSAAVQNTYNTLGGQIDDQYALQQKQLTNDMAARGLSDSSIAGGKLSDLNIGQRSAKEQLAASLATQQAQDLSGATSNAINLGLSGTAQGQTASAQNYAQQLQALGFNQNNANTNTAQQSAILQQILGYGQQGFNNDVTTQNVNQNSQNEEDQLQEYLLSLQ